MGVAPPKKQMRWGRVFMPLLVLAGIGAGIYLLITR